MSLDRNKKYRDMFKFLFKKGKKPFSIPEEGRKVKITWLPSCRNVPNGTPNPYVGMEGTVSDLKPDGSFMLCGLGHSLVVGNEYQFKYID